MISSIQLSNRDASVYASEGQQRSIALALKLAQARVLEETAENPPLSHRRCLWRTRSGPAQSSPGRAAAAAQKLITTTALDWLEAPRDAAILHLSEGSFTKK